MDWFEIIKSFFLKFGKIFKETTIQSLSFAFFLLTLCLRVRGCYCYCEPLERKSSWKYFPRSFRSSFFYVFFLLCVTSQQTRKAGCIEIKSVSSFNPSVTPSSFQRKRKTAYHRLNPVSPGLSFHFFLWAGVAVWASPSLFISNLLLSFELIVADKKSACAAIGGALKARKGWSLEKCEIECCTGNKCNTQTPILSEDTAIPVFLPPGKTHFLLTQSEVRTVSYTDRVFPLWFMAQARRLRAIHRKGKNKDP